DFRWSAARLAGILKSKAVLGILETGQKAKDRSAAREHEGYYPRIVSDEVFVQAQRIDMTKRHTRPPRNEARKPHLLAGLLKCAHCGSTMGKGAKWGTARVSDGARKR